jgi:hypothetical protein
MLAATLTVNTLSEVGDATHLSLRQAIVAVNNLSSAGIPSSQISGTIDGINDVIHIAVSGTIALNNSGHPGELQINRNLTITGPTGSPGDLTVQAYDPDNNGEDDQDGSRIFNIAADTVVEISYLTLTGGDVDGDGGAILAVDCDLNLHDLMITGNHSSACGGGVAYTAAPSNPDSYHLSIADTSFLANRSFSGYDPVELMIEAGGVGGGLYVSLSNNEAISGNPVATATIEDSLFRQNIAGTEGGGIRADVTGGALEISTSVIANNEARHNGEGGGILVFGFAQASTSSDFQLSQSLVIGNKQGLAPENPLANGAGGGISFLQFDGSALIESSTIAYNMAGEGGGIAWSDGYGSLTVVNSTIAKNTGEQGGGVRIPALDRS